MKVRLNKNPAKNVTEHKTQSQRQVKRKFLRKTGTVPRQESIYEKHFKNISTVCIAFINIYMQKYTMHPGALYAEKSNTLRGKNTLDFGEKIKPS